MRRLPFMLVLVLTACFLPAAAYADDAMDALQPADAVGVQADNIAEGTWGTCPWEISADGVLTVHPGEGEDTGNECPWKDYGSSVTSVVFAEENGAKVVAPADCSSLCRFYYATSIDLSGFDAANARDMSKMFSWCFYLKSLNLSGVDTSNVTNMESMFQAPDGGPIINWDTWHGGDHLDLSRLDTSSVTNMSNMFAFCRFSTLDLSSFDTSNVTDMSYMFMKNSLQSLDLSSFDTSSVKDMGNMFWGGTIETIDLSSFETSSVENMTMMFALEPELTTIYVGDGWSTAGLEGDTSMFMSCSSLVGGAGTKCDGGEGDASLSTYARIDGGPDSDTPGYLTYKKRDISGAVVKLAQDSYAYDGKAHEPAVTVELDGVAVPTDGYDVAYAGNVEVGTATVTVTGKGKYEGEAKAEFKIVAAPKDEGAGGNGDGGAASGASGGSAPASGADRPKSMHRLYNQWSGEHFYTSDDEEFAGLVALGWADEGEGWKAPEKSDTPVFRMYNPYAGEHHYTMDADEKDSMIAAGWEDEGIGWYSDDAQTVPLFREYNPNEPANNHNYTTSREEHDNLVSLGWVDEGRAWYGV